MKEIKTANYRRKQSEFEEDNDELKKMEDEFYRGVIANINTFNQLGPRFGFLKLVESGGGWYDLFLADDAQGTNQKLVDSSSILEMKDIIEEIFREKMRNI